MNSELAIGTRAVPKLLPLWWTGAIEGVVLAGLFLFHLLSFERTSPVHGPFEVFAQDSVYLLQSLMWGQAYPWNPQSHILYHYVLERGHAIWMAVVGSSPESAFLYLKLFTALCGLGFLAGMRWVFVELGIHWAGRVVLLLLSGFSVSAWFHFAAFETHSLAMPALALYLVALVRLRKRRSRTRLDRALLIGSLVVCGWTRVDLFRFAIVSALLPVLPGLRRQWRGLVADLAIVVVLWGAGNVWLAHTYLRKPLNAAITAPLERGDRRSLSGRIGRLANLEFQALFQVARGVSLYSIAMPVAPRPPRRSFFEPPTYVLNLQYSGNGDYPSTSLFVEPARNMLGTALSLVTLSALAVTLMLAGLASLKRAAEGDVVHVMLSAQAIAGWLLYTWFNPFEPFLWSLEFMPLWMVLLADQARGGGRVAWMGLGVVALVVGAHNWFAFYIPFR